eukprot:11159129-Alexandrium_andersonii.AAC.1
MVLKCRVQATSENCQTASGVRTWNCAGQGMASKSLPEAIEGWIRRRRRLRGVSCTAWTTTSRVSEIAGAGRSRSREVP